MGTTLVILGFGFEKIYPFFSSGIIGAIINVISIACYFVGTVMIIWQLIVRKK